MTREPRHWPARRAARARRGRGIGRGAFTLIELLVVITIIGILVGLVTYAVFQALKRAEGAAMYHEISNMHTGMETLRDQLHDYPPDGSGGPDKLQKFISKAFPNYTGGGKQTPPELMDTKMGPAKALVFWLSELSKDKRNPFKKDTSSFGGSNKHEYKNIYYEFDESRIRGGMYFPKGYDVNNDPPYIYFSARSPYDRSTFEWKDRPFKPYNKGQSSNQSGRGGGNNMDWYQPSSFQIICAGLDKKLGSGGTLALDTQAASASKLMVSKDDEDNYVNFDSREVGNIKN